MFLRARWRAACRQGRLRSSWLGPRAGGDVDIRDQLQLAQGRQGCGRPLHICAQCAAHSVALFGKHKGPWYSLKPGQAQQPALWVTPFWVPCRQMLGDSGEGAS